MFQFLKTKRRVEFARLQTTSCVFFSFVNTGVIESLDRGSDCAMKDSPVISGGLSIVTTDCITEHLCKVQEVFFFVFFDSVAFESSTGCELVLFFVFLGGEY